MKTVIGLHCK